MLRVLRKRNQLIARKTFFTTRTDRFYFRKTGLDVPDQIIWI